MADARRGLNEDVTTYLEQFIARISSVPAELKRNFALIQELDKKTQTVKQQVEQNEAEYLAMRHKGNDSAKTLMDTIESQQNMCVTYADEKITMAQQSYDLIDSHIRTLDQELRRFETELHLLESTTTTNERRVVSDAAHQR